MHNATRYGPWGKPEDVFDRGVHFPIGELDYHRLKMAPMVKPWGSAEKKAVCSRRDPVYSQSGAISPAVISSKLGRLRITAHLAPLTRTSGAIARVLYCEACTAP